MNAYGVAEVRGVRGLLLWIVGSMLIIEGVGAGLLYYRFHDWYLSIFYSVMSFCNAGFSVYSDSLARFAADPFVLFVLAAETILGGIGFLVIYNICTFKFLRRKSGARGRLSLHSAVVLRFSLYLTAFAFAVFLACEWTGALRDYGWGQKLWVAFYQAVTPRSCGFTVIPLEALRVPTIEIYEWMMFIGGAPGSVAAGIKVTTFAVIIYTVFAMCRGEQETVISRRVISYDVVRESIVIVVAMLLLVALVHGVLVGVEPRSEESGWRLFFEALSAVTTTGLSIGDTTARLTPIGRAVIMVGMFCGRLGALTVVLLIGARESKRHVRYPNEELVVG
jgi:trk system potassium uptake protein TrkH